MTISGKALEDRAMFFQPIAVVIFSFAPVMQPLDSTPANTENVAVTTISSFVESFPARLMEFSRRIDLHLAVLYLQLLCWQIEHDQISLEEKIEFLDQLTQPLQRDPFRFDDGVVPPLSKGQRRT